MLKKVKYYIKNLELKKHPEGGYFNEVYRAKEEIKKENLPARFSGDRNFSTSIYFLLDEENISYFHKIKSDEIWHFYDGSTIRIYTIKNKDELSIGLLGRNISKGEQLQVIIKKGIWFCAEVVGKKDFGLVGCTVSPGFDFEDFTLAKRDTLLKKFPKHKKIIKRFTKG